jgi:hypothetical protein
MLPALNSYLHQHHSLCIPGIGTIYIERTPARSDFTNRQILPPGYHYRFDRFFDTPDKNFFSFIARARNIQEFEAIRWYNEWAYEVGARLRKESVLQWEGIGTISRNDTGDVVFETFAPIEAHLVPVPAERIVRINTAHTMLVGDKETTNLQMTGFLSDSDKRSTRKNNWLIYGLLAVALILLVVFLLMYKN